MYDILTDEDVANHARKLWDAWQSNDPDRILDVYTGGLGFGYRTREARDTYGDKASYKKVNDGWWAMVEQTMDYYIFKLDELHTRSFGDFGMAWGFYHEKFKVKGKDAVEFRGRFSQTFVRDQGEWKMLFYHRDMTPFDKDGKFIPPAQ